MRQTPSTYKAVFFDVDGVLIDSLGEHLRFAQDKNIEYSLGLSIPDVSRMSALIRANITVNPMLNFLIAAGFPSDAASNAESDYERFFLELYTLRPFPGIGDMLDTLSDRGIVLGYVTANVRHNVERPLGDLLRRFDPRWRFTKDDVRASSKADALRLATRLLAVDSPDVLYVGDQASDRRAAEQAGVSFLGVTYGWGLAPGDKASPLAESPASIADYILSAR